MTDDRRRLELKPGRLDIGPEGVAFQADGGHQRVALPPDARAIIGILLDRPGLAIDELVATLHARTGTVRFRALGATIQALGAANALVDGSGDSGPQAKPTIGMRIEGALTRRLPLFRRYERSGGPSQAVFRVLASVLIVVAGFALHGDIPGVHLTKQFLRVDKSYLSGALLAVGVWSALQSVQHGMKAVLLYFGQGVVPGGGLQITPLSVSFEAADDDFYATAKPLSSTLYGLASVATPIVFAAAVAPALPFAWSEQVSALALLFSLWELRPYGGGESHRVAGAFVRDELDGAAVPYLKRRIFAGLFTGRSSAGENRLVLYGSLALAWTLACLMVLQRLVSLNTSSFASAFVGPHGSVVAALGLFAAIAGALGLLVMDLVGTVARNMASPFEGKAQQLRRRLGSREDRTTSMETAGEALAGVPLFRECGPEARAKLAEQGSMRHYGAGAPILVQGEVGRELFVLVEGTVRVDRRDDLGRTLKVAELTAPCVFGELAVLQDTLRTADVVAVGPVKVLVLQGASFKALTQDPALAAEFAGCVDRIALEQYFASSPAFVDVPDSVIGTLLGHGEFVAYNAGSTVFEQGGPGDGFFLVLRGVLDVVKDGATVAEVAQGSFVGEIALLSASPRTATVRAKTDSRLLRLSAAHFWDIVSRNLGLAMFLEGEAERRAANAARVGSAA